MYIRTIIIHHNLQIILSQAQERIKLREALKKKWYKKESILFYRRFFSFTSHILNFTHFSSVRWFSSWVWHFNIAHCTYFLHIISFLLALLCRNECFWRRTCTSTYSIHILHDERFSGCHRICHICVLWMSLLFSKKNILFLRRVFLQFFVVKSSSLVCMRVSKIECSTTTTTTK